MFTGVKPSGSYLHPDTALPANTSHSGEPISWASKLEPLLRSFRHVPWSSDPSGPTESLLVLGRSGQKTG